MAPPPEYDKEPKAPDKSATNTSCEETKTVHNLANDQPSNSDNKSASTATNAEVENNKLVETLDDGQLRALLDEAINYKCPKDREGKSNLFKELLEAVEQDEQAPESAARGAGARASARAPPRPNRNRRALPHSNSMQDLVAALAAEPAPRRHRPAPTPATASVSARAIHGGSLPSGVDTSFLLSEEPTTGASYLATVRCVNPLPLSERRVSVSDTNATADVEMVTRRSKPASFPMTYTARATLEIQAPPPRAAAPPANQVPYPSRHTQPSTIPPRNDNPALTRPPKKKRNKKKDTEWEFMRPLSPIKEIKIAKKAKQKTKSEKTKHQAEPERTKQEAVLGKTKQEAQLEQTKRKVKPGKAKQKADRGKTKQKAGTENGKPKAEQEKTKQKADSENTNTKAEQEKTKYKAPKTTTPYKKSSREFNAAYLDFIRPSNIFYKPNETPQWDFVHPFNNYESNPVPQWDFMSPSKKCKVNETPHCHFVHPSRKYKSINALQWNYMSPSNKYKINEVPQSHFMHPSNNYACNAVPQWDYMNPSNKDKRNAAPGRDFTSPSNKYKLNVASIKDTPNEYNFKEATQSDSMHLLNKYKCNATSRWDLMSPSNKFKEARQSDFTSKAENTKQKAEPKKTKQKVELQNTKQQAETENSQHKAEPETTEQKAKPENTKQKVEPENIRQKVEPGKAKLDAEPDKSKHKTESENTKQEAKPRNNKKKAVSENTKQKAKPENTTQKVEPEKIKQNVEPGKSKLEAEPDKTKQIAELENAKQETKPGNTKQKADSENTKPKAKPENTTQKVKPVNNKQESEPEKIKQKVEPRMAKLEAEIENTKMKAVSENTKVKAKPETTTQKADPEKNKQKAEPERTKQKADLEKTKQKGEPEKTKQRANSENTVDQKIFHWDFMRPSKTHKPNEEHVDFKRPSKTYQFNATPEWDFMGQTNIFAFNAVPQKDLMRPSCKYQEFPKTSASIVKSSESKNPGILTIPNNMIMESQTISPQVQGEKKKNIFNKQKNMHQNDPSTSKSPVQASKTWARSKYNHTKGNDILPIEIRPRSDHGYYDRPMQERLYSYRLSPTFGPPERLYSQKIYNPYRKEIKNKERMLRNLPLDISCVRDTDKSAVLRDCASSFPSQTNYATVQTLTGNTELDSEPLDKNCVGKTNKSVIVQDNADGIVLQNQTHTDNIELDCESFDTNCVRQTNESIIVEDRAYSIASRSGGQTLTDNIRLDSKSLDKNCGRDQNSVSVEGHVDDSIASQSDCAVTQDHAVTDNTKLDSEFSDENCVRDTNESVLFKDADSIAFQSNCASAFTQDLTLAENNNCNSESLYKSCERDTNKIIILEDNAPAKSYHAKAVTQDQILIHNTKLDNTLENESSELKISPQDKIDHIQLKLLSALFPKKTFNRENISGKHSEDINNEINAEKEGHAQIQNSPEESTRKCESENITDKRDNELKSSSDNIKKDEIKDGEIDIKLSANINDWYGTLKQYDPVPVLCNNVQVNIGRLKSEEQSFAPNKDEIFKWTEYYTTKETHVSCPFKSACNIKRNTQKIAQEKSKYITYQEESHSKKDANYMLDSVNEISCGDDFGYNTYKERQNYRERVGNSISYPKLEVNPRNIRSMTIGKPLPEIDAEKCAADNSNHQHVSESVDKTSLDNHVKLVKDFLDSSNNRNEVVLDLEDVDGDKLKDIHARSSTPTTDHEQNKDVKTVSDTVETGIKENVVQNHDDERGIEDVLLNPIVNQADKGLQTDFVELIEEIVEVKLVKISLRAHENISNEPKINFCSISKPAFKNVLEIELTDDANRELQEKKSVTMYLSEQHRLFQALKVNDTFQNGNETTILEVFRRQSHKKLNDNHEHADYSVHNRQENTSFATYLAQQRRLFQALGVNDLVDNAREHSLVINLNNTENVQSAKDKDSRLENTSFATYSDEQYKLCQALGVNSLADRAVKNALVGNINNSVKVQTLKDKHSEFKTQDAQDNLEKKSINISHKQINSEDQYFKLYNNDKVQSAEDEVSELVKVETQDKDVEESRNLSIKPTHSQSEYFDSFDRSEQVQSSQAENLELVTEATQDKHVEESIYVVNEPTNFENKHFDRNNIENVHVGSEKCFEVMREDAQDKHAEESINLSHEPTYSEGKNFDSKSNEKVQSEGSESVSEDAPDKHGEVSVILSNAPINVNGEYLNSIDNSKQVQSMKDIDSKCVGDDAQETLAEESSVLKETTNSECKYNISNNSEKVFVKEEARDKHEEELRNVSNELTYSEGIDFDYLDNSEQEQIIKQKGSEFFIGNAQEKHAEESISVPNEMTNSDIQYIVSNNIQKSQSVNEENSELLSEDAQYKQAEKSKLEQILSEYLNFIDNSKQVQSIKGKDSECIRDNSQETSAEESSNVRYELNSDGEFIDRNNSKEVQSVKNKCVMTAVESASGEKCVQEKSSNNAYVFLTLPENLLNNISNTDGTILLQNEHSSNKKSNKKSDPAVASEKKKVAINKKALQTLLFGNLSESDGANDKSKELSTASKNEVDSTIPFSCITTPEVMASCNTTSSTAQSTVAVDPKSLQRDSSHGVATSLTGDVEESPASPPAPLPAPHRPPHRRACLCCRPMSNNTPIPRSVVTSSFNGLPLSRPNYGSTATTQQDEFKKSLDENGNSVQAYSSPLSGSTGSSQHKKPRRKKSSKNETVIKSHQIDGYQGNKDLNEVLRFIESNAESTRAGKLRPKHKDDSDDKGGKKRSTERRKDKESKIKRATSLEELSRTKLEDLTDKPGKKERRNDTAPKAERRSWGDDARDSFYYHEPEPQDADFQTVTKKRKPRRRADDSMEHAEPASGDTPRPARPPEPRARRVSAPPSDRSNDSNDDMDSVHSLPADAPKTVTHAPVSYADIARTRHNIPDLIESCNFYSEGGEEMLQQVRPDKVEKLESPPSAVIDSDGYPALEPRAPRRHAPNSGPTLHKPSHTHTTTIKHHRKSERAETSTLAGECPAPDVVADRRPPVILLDPGRGHDMDGVTFGFDINEQLLGGPTRRPRCDLVRDAIEVTTVPSSETNGNVTSEPESPPEPAGADLGNTVPSGAESILGGVAVMLSCAALRYVAPRPPADTTHLHQIIDYVGTAWDDVLRCGSGKVRYFNE